MNFYYSFFSSMKLIALIIQLEPKYSKDYSILIILNSTSPSITNDSMSETTLISLWSIAWLTQTLDSNIRMVWIWLAI